MQDKKAQPMPNLLSLYILVIFVDLSVYWKLGIFWA